MNKQFFFDDQNSNARVFSRKIFVGCLASPKASSFATKAPVASVTSVAEAPVASETSVASKELRVGLSCGLRLRQSKAHRDSGQ